MSIIQWNKENQNSYLIPIPTDKDGKITAKESLYLPEKNVIDRTMQIINAFTLGDMNMRTPRREWNDMATLDRLTVDQMSFNTYQPNNGDGSSEDVTESWRSKAMRPVVRNKVISIAAHATARLIFPKIFARDDNSDAQEEAAQVMMDLMEYAADQCDYKYLSLQAILTALWSPASIVYTGYNEYYREVKREKEGDTWRREKMLDENLSGFKSTVVPVDELYIENIYEHDIQKQGFLIWRRVIPYSLAQAKYGTMENFRYVTPGVQLIYNDANQLFYNVYDDNMREYDVEEIIYFYKGDDIQLTLLNGVMMEHPDTPNPRNDKQYPFAKFGYELVDEGKFFYYKSLAFKIQQDAKIINTLYPMIVDGTYLSMMPPMIISGSETIASDVIVPGAVTTVAAEGATITPIQTAQNLVQAGNTLDKVEESFNESSQDPVQQGANEKLPSTAYALSRIEQNAATVLGLFIQMISNYVQQYGKLQMSDILQFLTIADVVNIEGGGKLAYKTFLLNDKSSEKGSKNKKITFDIGLPSEPISDDEYENLSFDVLEEQGGEDSKTELYKVNPQLFRRFKFDLKISPDVLNPMSEDLERAFMLEEYDRAIANPRLDQEAVTRDFLLAAYPKSRKDPDKYLLSDEDLQMQQQAAMAPTDLQTGQGPLQSLGKGLPQSGPQLSV
jgi:hypothetical protein